MVAPDCDHETPIDNIKCMFTRPRVNKLRHIALYATGRNKRVGLSMLV